MSHNQQEMKVPITTDAVAGSVVKRTVNGAAVPPQHMQTRNQHTGAPSQTMLPRNQHAAGGPSQTVLARNQHTGVPSQTTLARSQPAAVPSQNNMLIRNHQSNPPTGVPPQNMLPRNQPTGVPSQIMLPRTAPPPPPSTVLQQRPQAMTPVVPGVRHNNPRARGVDLSEKEYMWNNNLPREQPVYSQNAARQAVYIENDDQTYQRRELETSPQSLPDRLREIYPPKNQQPQNTILARSQDDGRRESLSSRRRSTVDLGVILDLNPVFYSAALTSFSALMLFQSVVDCSASEQDECDNGSYTLTIVVANFTILMAFIIPLIWVFFVSIDRSVKETADRLCPLFSIVIVVFWGITTPFVTFTHPYKFAGNGYFFAWALFSIALYFAKDVNEEFKNFMGKVTNALFGVRFDRNVARTLILISLFFVISAAVNFADDSDETWESWFVLFAGVTSLMVLLVYEVAIGVLGWYQDEPETDPEDPSASLYDFVEPPIQIISIFLVVIWFAVALVSTFNKTSPFKTLGNGYFASWACAFDSLLLLLAVYGFVDKQGVL